jgi:hypothetical protein
MRLWSLHPQLLDGKGLVALWREGLLAKHVLEGKTKGYKNHPQLDRFKAHPQPIVAIHTYLLGVWEEAQKRGYNFDRTKISPRETIALITVTDGQLAYELEHLHRKVQQRDPAHYASIRGQPARPHVLFQIEKGPVANWEIRRE